MSLAAIQSQRDGFGERQEFGMRKLARELRAERLVSRLESQNNGQSSLKCIKYCREVKIILPFLGYVYISLL